MYRVSHACRISEYFASLEVVIISKIHARYSGKTHHRGMEKFEDNRRQSQRTLPDVTQVWLFRNFLPQNERRFTKLKTKNTKDERDEHGSNCDYGNLGQTNIWLLCRLKLDAVIDSAPFVIVSACAFLAYQAQSSSRRQYIKIRCVSKVEKSEGWYTVVNSADSNHRFFVAFLLPCCTHFCNVSVSRSQIRWHKCFGTSRA